MTERFITNIARFALGGIFLIFGFDGFFEFMPGEVYEGDAGKYMAGLRSAGYFMPFLKIVEIVMGLMLIAGLYTALALVILMPVTINIFLFNLFLNPSSLPLGIVVLLAHIYLAWVHRKQYAGLFKNI